MTPPSTDQKSSSPKNEDGVEKSKATTGSQYTIAEADRHPDPILCRLLLNDQFGKPIKNPKLFFRDCKVVGFFFSAIWKYDRDSFQQNVMDLCHRNPHRFKCIYISIDSSKQDFDKSTKEKPWVNMIWEDGSNMEEEKPAKLDKMDFITPLEQELVKKILAGKVDLLQDPRPLSRVGLCSGLDVLFAPTLMVYHLESKTWLDSNVSHAAIGSREKREVALETWEKGERLTLTLMDILVGLRWAILIGTLGIIYVFLVRADDAYNIVHLVEYFMAGAAENSATNAPSTSPGPSSPPMSHHLPPKNSHEYVEF
ncbi:hypothetical protein PTTG_02934 [Puccinia triticina 1-1 BBBD Race 1]|uniref:Thioredoxin-like_fold domain-containing protein n=1 Tax=Puccinia triticina (isolate 1-1 / race 1 (BBBD)) TaxID=630390 RepID=A0A0C4DF18_PUCT1|nr:hypothetical protein PTTG_02934 [Puccinia triticina 1-1 BBBD Race 1]WAR55138.1 hypothetical protein PtB15_4B758 [Puccinia triticina]